MLGSNKEKEISKGDALKKVEAWKTINEVLVKTNSNFMDGLSKLLSEKQAQHEQLKAKLDKNEGTEEENASYIFLGGYIQCLKDILGAKKGS